jgi:predicted RNase H-like nuclease
VSDYIGVDLAWGLGSATKAANETGLVALDADGTVVDAGWERGVEAVALWIEQHLGQRTLVAVDASLVVTNATGIREPERQVGQRYGAWRVSANVTNLATRAQAGVRLLDRLGDHAAYLASTDDMERRTAPGVFECYPYTTLVGAEELGYDIERPRYKRPDRSLPPATRRAAKAAVFDDLVTRVDGLSRAVPPVRIRSHPVTAALLEPSGTHGPTYKHREDLLDAVLCAWTAALWERHGDARVQVLGTDGSLPQDARDAHGRLAAIVAPARPEQRR